MDFYNLQENDHRLLEQVMTPSFSSTDEYQDYLKRHFFNFERVLNKKSILLAEEDPRVQRAMQKMIQEANKEANCWVVNSVEDISGVLSDKLCDLLIANYYLSEDEIDYEFWERIRERYPQMEVIILSHVNDREYYELLEKSGPRPRGRRFQPFFDSY
jgi:CheY-like chemotaxis protein